MNYSRTFPLIWFLLVLITHAPMYAFSANEAKKRIQITSGKVDFEVEANISALTIYGEVTRLEGELWITKTEKGISIEQFRIQSPSNSFTTGQELRDKHMYERIFQAADGTLPDVRYVAENTTCPIDTGKETCEIRGQLSLKSVSKPLSLMVGFTENGNGWEIKGETIVDTELYGVDKIEQLGVQLSNKVKVRTALQAQ